MERIKDFLVATFAAIVSGIVLIPMQSQSAGVDDSVILFIVAVGVIIGYLYSRAKCRKCDYKIKVIDVADTGIDGIGGTKAVLNECKKCFYFMGISANKWVNDASNFGPTMKRMIARHGYVRFLMLDPTSEEAKRMSRTSNPNLIQDIKRNIETIKKYHELGLNVEVRVYTHMPVFRIAIVDDDKKVYAGMYEVNDAGVDVNIKQLILISN